MNLEKNLYRNLEIIRGGCHFTTSNFIKILGNILWGKLLLRISLFSFKAPSLVRIIGRKSYFPKSQLGKYLLAAYWEVHLARWACKPLRGLCQYSCTRTWKEKSPLMEVSVLVDEFSFLWSTCSPPPPRQLQKQTNKWMPNSIMYSWKHFHCTS